MQNVSNTQRAFWAFLITTLAAPFLAALMVMIASVVSGAIGKGPESLNTLDTAGQFAWSGEKAIAAFVWSAIPASLAAVALSLVVFVRGSASWLVAATAGAIAGAGGAFFTGGLVAEHGAPVAFIGAVVGIAIWFS